MGNHQVPAPIEDVTDVPLNVGTSVICGKEVTTPRVVATLSEGSPHSPAEFARDEDPHATAQMRAVKLLSGFFFFPIWTTVPSCTA